MAINKREAGRAGYAGQVAVPESRAVGRSEHAPARTRKTEAA